MILLVVVFMILVYLVTLQISLPRVTGQGYLNLIINDFYEYPCIYKMFSVSYPIKNQIIFKR